MKSEAEIKHEIEIIEQMLDGANKQAALMLQAKKSQLEWVLELDD